MKKNRVLPIAFLEKIKSTFPKVSLSEFQKSCQRPLRKSIRINTLKISITDFQKRVSKKKWQLTPIPWCAEGFWIDRPEEDQKNIPLGNTMEHVLGLFYVQEASSMLPVEALTNGRRDGAVSPSKQKMKVLDMAAAPGSKTTQLAAAMKNQGLIVANEFSASRIKKLFSNLERCGVRNTALTHFDGNDFARVTPNIFDAILLDAPCTGEGTIRKDPDALAQWSERRIAIAAGVQKKLILAAFAALKPGGILIYSTCTLAPEENEEICHFLQKKFPGSVEFESLHDLFPDAQKAVTKEGFLRVWPHVFDTEGFFVARIRKDAHLSSPRTRGSTAMDSMDSRLRGNDRRKKFPFTPIGHSKFQSLQKYYREHFGFIFAFSAERLYEREREIWLFPEGIDQLIGQIRFDRIGIKLCEIHEKGIKTLHEMAIHFGGDFSQNVRELSAEEAQEFFAGSDLKAEMQNQRPGEVLLRFEGFVLGMGKWQKEAIKNQLPREMANHKVITK